MLVDLDQNHSSCAKWINRGEKGQRLMPVLMAGFFSTDIARLASAAMEMQSQVMLVSIGLQAAAGSCKDSLKCKFAPVCTFLHRC